MIKSTTTTDGLHITLSTALDSRSKKLQLAFAAMHFTAALGFIVWGFAGQESKGGSIALILIGTVFLVVTQRFLNKALLSEQLLVNPTELRLITVGFLRFRVRNYLLAGISGFQFTPPPPLSRHPLAENGSDLLGFQGEREIINHMHGDNAISFDYYGHLIKFGQDMNSWDVEQLEIFYTILPETI